MRFVVGWDSDAGGSPNHTLERTPATIRAHSDVIARWSVAGSAELGRPAREASPWSRMTTAVVPSVTAMTWRLSPTGSGTKLELAYSVGGFMAGGFEAMAPAVESVLREQADRLKRFVETGTPAAK